MVKQIYPSELKLNKANPYDTEAPFLDLHLTILGGIVVVLTVTCSRCPYFYFGSPVMLVT